jgi:PTH1 family peptidyl-tRNA hydrolase
MATKIRLVAGLGNVGREYASTRHNAGFWFADALSMLLRVAFVREAKFFGDTARAAGSDIRLVKPGTYMNLSGRSVATLANFYSIAPDEILVVHDELDLKPGEAKLKLGGGVAGHNGLKDIREKLGTPDFWRLRLGIGHPRESTLTEQEVADYVLKPPRPDEHEAIERAIVKALDAWPAIADGDFERAMLVLHTRPKKTEAVSEDQPKKGTE